MAIRLRRGNNADFDKNKLVAGELGLVLDAGKLYFCYSAGNTKQLTTAEDVQALLDASPEAYSALLQCITDLENNPSELTNILNNILTLQGSIGDLTQLETTSNTDLVGAVNENKGRIDTNTTDIGNKTTLTTTEKTNLVGAINEIDSLLSTIEVLTENPSVLWEGRTWIVRDYLKTYDFSTDPVLSALTSAVYGSNNFKACHANAGKNFNGLKRLSLVAEITYSAIQPEGKTCVGLFDSVNKKALVLYPRTMSTTSVELRGYLFDVTADASDNITAFAMLDYLVAAQATIAAETLYKMKLLLDGEGNWTLSLLGSDDAVLATVTETLTNPSVVSYNKLLFMAAHYNDTYAGATTYDATNKVVHMVGYPPSTTLASVANIDNITVLI